MSGGRKYSSGSSTMLRNWSEFSNTSISTCKASSRPNTSSQLSLSQIAALCKDLAKQNTKRAKVQREMWADIRHIKDELQQLQRRQFKIRGTDLQVRLNHIVRLRVRVYNTGYIMLLRLSSTLKYQRHFARAWGEIQQAKM